MNGELDPYAPPRADPVPAMVAIPGGKDSGSRWRVVEGRLEVRQKASLPDIPLDGSQPGTPGTRYPLLFETSALPGAVRAVGLLLLGIACLAGVLSSPFTGNLLLLATAVGPGWLKPRLRVRGFRSKSQDSAFVLVALLAISTVGFLLLAIASRWPEVFPAYCGIYLGMALGVYQLILILRGKVPPAREVGDGWFHLKGAAPQAIRRLEEIQQGQPPQLEESPAQRA